MQSRHVRDTSVLVQPGWVGGRPVPRDQGMLIVLLAMCRCATC